LLGFLKDAENLFFRVSLLHGFWLGYPIQNSLSSHSSFRGAGQILIQIEYLDKAVLYHNTTRTKIEYYNLTGSIPLLFATARSIFSYLPVILEISNLVAVVMAASLVDDILLRFNPAIIPSAKA